MITETDIKRLQYMVTYHNDQTAFKQLYEIYYKELFRFAATFLDKTVLVEEVLQDVFTKIWLNREKLNEVINLRVYLFRCIKNKCLDYIDKEKALNYLELEDIDIKMVHSSPSPEDIMISAEVLQQVNRIILELPPKCKMVFRLVREENLKYKEVAEILNVSLKTVENHMGIALKRINKAMPTRVKNS